MLHSYRQITNAMHNAGPPRPYFDVTQLRARAQGRHLKTLIRQLRADADSNEPLPGLPYRLYRTYQHTGDRHEYESRYFRRRRLLNSAAVVAMIAPEPQAVERLSDILWEICDEYTWALPAHVRFDTTLGDRPDRCIDLFAAETAHALAEIVTVLSDRLEPAVRGRVETAVRSRVLVPFLDDPRSRWWETGTNNWAAVCGSAIGMAGLALETDPMRLSALVARVERTLESFLSGFGDDGGCYEGNEYWIYGYGYYVYFAEALRERTGLDLLPGTEAIASFPAAIDFGNGNCASFSDGSDRTVMPTGLMSLLHKRLQVALPQLPRVSEFGDDHCYRWAHLSRTLLWSTEDIVNKPVENGSAWLPDLAWAIERRVDDDTVIAFAAKGGHNDEEHNQLDLGSFILSVGGQQLLCDLGAGLYDADYFGPKRYDALHTSAAGHSVPSIGGAEQQPGRQYSADVTRYERGGSSTHLSLDLSRAYDHAAGFARSFAWDGAATRLTMTDSFADAGLSLTERFISKIEPQVLNGHVVWRGEFGEVELAHADVWRREVEPIVTQDHHGRTETVYRLNLHARTAPSHEFEFRVTLPRALSAGPTLRVRPQRF